LLAEIFRNLKRNTSMCLVVMHWWDRLLFWRRRFDNDYLASDWFGTILFGAELF